MRTRKQKSQHPIEERREFLKGSGLLALTLGNPLVPWAFQALMNSATAQAETSANPFVFIFLRGGADGLSILPPAPGHPERALYEAARPHLKLELQDMNVLGNTRYGLNNACPNLLSLYNGGYASFYHGVGNKSSNSRSHFIQQDYIDRGGLTDTQTGFLNRTVATSSSPVPAIVAGAAGASLSKALRGTSAGANDLIVPISGLSKTAAEPVNIPGGSGQSGLFSRFDGLFVGLGLAERLQATWSQASGSLGQRATAAANLLNSITSNPAVQAIEPKDYGKLSQFKTAAQLLVGCPTLKYLTIDVDGWDTHDLMGPKAGGYFHNLLKAFDKALGQFMADIAPVRDKVRIVIISEFGRPLRENGTQGLDHGRGGLAITIGPRGEGGRIYSQGFTLSSLEDNRDIKVTLDHRELLGHILKKANPRITDATLATIFPRAASDSIALTFTIA